MYQNILFDLDGTLTNSELGITNSVAYALEKFGIEVQDKKELRVFIGPPLKYSFEHFYGFSEEESLQAVEYYREYFSEKASMKMKFIKGFGKYCLLSNKLIRN